MSITRTTISIDAGLLSTAKQQAERQSLTLGQLVSQALQRYVADVAAPPTRLDVRLPTSGQGGVRPGIDLSSNAELFASQDEQDIARWSSSM